VARVAILVTTAHQVIFDVSRAEVSEMFPRFTARAFKGAGVVELGHVIDFTPQAHQRIFALRVRCCCNYVLLHEVVLSLFRVAFCAHLQGRVLKGVRLLPTNAADNHVEVAALQPSLLHVGCEFVDWLDGVALAA
jgi:hypothetical protein